MATTTTLLGLKKPAYTDAADIEVINGNMDAIDAAIGERTYPHNLLVNSLFNSDVAIDQRGVGTGVWTPAAYNIDMWYQTQYGSVSLSQDGLTLDATAETTNACQVMQYISHAPLGKYTFVAKVNGSVVSRVISFDGTASTSVDGTNATYTGGYISMGYNSNKKALQPTFRVNAGYAITVEWAAVYQGDFRKGALPAYVWKGYAAELSECQRYLYKWREDTGAIMGAVSGTTSTQGRIVINTPLPMYSKPSVKMDDYKTARVLPYYVTITAEPTVGNTWANTTAVVLLITVETSMTLNSLIAFKPNQAIYLTCEP